jgi:hypothetical protein
MQEKGRSMLIEFYQRKLYGKNYLYPHSDDARTICELINRPTLTLKHLRICKGAGWRIVEVICDDDREDIEI